MYTSTCIYNCFELTALANLETPTILETLYWGCVIHVHVYIKSIFNVRIHFRFFYKSSAEKTDLKNNYNATYLSNS